MMGFFPPSASGFAPSTTRSTSHRPLIRLGSEGASGREGVRSIVRSHRRINDREIKRVVVAILDINQCLKLADELTGKRPERHAAYSRVKQQIDVPGDGLMRGSLSNVCFANELQRNGLGYVIVTKSKTVASFCAPRLYAKMKSLLGNIDLYSRMILAKSTFKK
ncbi:hypothetical protein C4D60_Mb07t23470 [Musa balbisiana]|uniref:Uncharacterized protein n=1 Tax=Musa balbisiana TaxID=52838 RepID=A0A4V4H6W2_MUSBA|nr:hypothetical protein C4D60_Mb07t23470 [Musa balbisiana]